MLSCRRFSSCWRVAWRPQHVFALDSGGHETVDRMPASSCSYHVTDCGLLAANLPPVRPSVVCCLVGLGSVSLRPPTNLLSPYACFPAAWSAHSKTILVAQRKYVYLPVLCCADPVFGHIHSTVSYTHLT